MDPALRELLQEEEGNPDRTIEAIVRLRDPAAVIPGMQVVAAFGSIVTCRIKAADVPEVWAHPLVLSCKPGRGLAPDRELRPSGPAWLQPDAGDIRRPSDLPLTGAGVVLAAVDWGLDFAADCFRLPDGRTRLIGLWDQRQSAAAPGGPSPYGYGAVHTREAIDAALRTPRPYETLGYHPADADSGTGAHGTHVLDIAAGNGRSGGPEGIARDAELAFVHLADRDTGGLANLGDSLRMLEAFDWVRSIAGDLPWVVNVSCGRHGGPHSGRTPTEMALDELLETTPGCFVVQSAGNYHQAGAHTSGRVPPGGQRTLRFTTHVADTTPNELEVWYAGSDAFDAVVIGPADAVPALVVLGAAADLLVDGVLVGRAYHRARDPNDLGNVLDVFLYPQAPAGEWTVRLLGRRIHDGRFHAWLERDSACEVCQTRFRPTDVVRTTTTGTLANGRLPLVVGAYDGQRSDRAIASFSSSGPTRDGRCKPDLVAPGVDVLAARSAPRGAERSPNGLTRKSGTSMATPQVAGAVALCLQARGAQLRATEIRELVLSTVQPPAPTHDPQRVGRGFLDLHRLVAALGVDQPPRPARQERVMTTTATSIRTHTPCGCGGHRGAALDPVSVLAAAPGTAYRELLYRPEDPLGRWVREQFSVLARPGEPMATTRPGDVLLSAMLGSPSSGRLAVLDAPLPHQRRPLPAGRLLLRPRETEPAPGAAVDAPFAEDVPTHVKDARTLWSALRLPADVTIHDMATVPSRLVRDADFLAWTNSPNAVFVAASANRVPGRLAYTVFHEAQHIEQFRTHAFTRPPSYVYMIRFECDAYAATARWAQSNTDPQIRAHAGRLAANARVFCDEIAAAARARLTLDQLDARYRKFLIRTGALPNHRDLANLYETFPPRETLDTAPEDAEAVDLGAIWRQLGGPGTVRIRHVDELPNEALREFIVSNGIAAWTNSARDVHVVPGVDADAALAKVVLHHELQHVRQFTRQGGPPPSWAHMMRFERLAYQASVDWISRHPDPDVKAHLSGMDVHAKRFATEIDRAAAAHLARPALEERYRRFLVDQTYVPPGFRDARDLYRSAAPAADAEGGTFEDLLGAIAAELRTPFTDPNDPGLHQRRQRLRGLVGSIPADRRKELLDRLGERPTGDPLSRLFHHRLHRATRRELLDILRRGIPAAPVPPPTPAFLNTYEPLPASEQTRYDAAVRSLTAKIDATHDARNWRYRCWLAKLAAGADDRVISWHRICPRKTGAIGAAYLVGPCDITAGSAVDQTELQNAISTVADVEPANRRLSFITHLRPQLVWITELTSDQFHLENLRQLHDEVQLAITNLDIWANNPMGGSSAMPTAYVSIKDWIGRRQRDPNSLYSCM